MKKTLIAASLGALAMATAATSASQAQTDNAYIGDTIMVGYNFCPRGWTEAGGQMLNPNTFQALFSLIGTYYGGDGRTTFAVPDLRGRIPINHGQAPGFTGTYPLGSRSGTETVTLGSSQLARHTHSLMATNTGNDAVTPQGNSFTTLTGTGEAAYNTGVDIAFENDAVANTGQNQPVNIMSQSLVIRYCIALQGIYPSRN